MRKTKTTSSRQTDGQELEFQAVDGKRVFVQFDEPEITCEAGLLALAQFEKGTGLFDSLAGCLSNQRSRPEHNLRDLLAQRVMQIAAGDGDTAGCSRLRGDSGLQLAAGKQRELASQPTMGRLENSVAGRDLLPMAYALGESFLDSIEGAAPKMVAIDMGPTAHLVYGTQQLSLFNSYVGDSCLMPFHVYDGVTGRLTTGRPASGQRPLRSRDPGPFANASCRGYAVVSRIHVCSSARTATTASPKRWTGCSRTRWTGRTAAQQRPGRDLPPRDRASRRGLESSDSAIGRRTLA